MIWMGSQQMTYVDFPTYLGCEAVRTELIQKRWYNSKDLLCVERK